MLDQNYFEIAAVMDGITQKIATFNSYSTQAKRWSSV